VYSARASIQSGDRAYIGLPARMSASHCAAKAGVVSLTKTLAIEWARYNVWANRVAPAHAETERVKDEVRAGIRDISRVVERTPIKRLGYPNEVANVVGFSASDDASFVTDETVVVDGGWLAYGYVQLACYQFSIIRKSNHIGK
jgi:NAD(P)-dependent dehydrogenase (short-subunit alcohol dehydrogenase family)